MKSEWTLWSGFLRAFVLLREVGLRRAWFRGLGETVFRRIVLLRRSLEEVLPEQRSSIAITIDFLDPSEAESYEAFHPKITAADVRRRLAAGERCFVARHGNDMAHAAWADPTRCWIEYVEREAPMGDDEVHIVENYTHADYRGHNVAAAVSAEMDRQFRNAGYRYLLGSVLPENTASRRVLSKAGYEPFTIIGYVKLGHRRCEFKRTTRMTLAR